MGGSLFCSLMRIVDSILGIRVTRTTIKLFYSYSFIHKFLLEIEKVLTTPSYPKITFSTVNQLCMPAVGYCEENPCCLGLQRADLFIISSQS